jgi:hypothetical protein
MGSGIMRYFGSIQVGNAHRQQFLRALTPVSCRVAGVERQQPDTDQE